MEDAARDVTWTKDVEWPEGEPLPVSGKPVENVERFGIHAKAIAYVDKIESEWSRENTPPKHTVTLRFYMTIA